MVQANRQPTGRPGNAPTDGDVATWVCRGTTSRPDKVIVLYNDGTTALVKHPSETIGTRLFPDYVSPWVDKYDLTQMDKHRMGMEAHCEVWNCASDRDGRLTPKRLRALVKRLGLDEVHIREYRRQSNKETNCNARQPGSAQTASSNSRTTTAVVPPSGRIRKDPSGTRSKIKRLIAALDKTRDALERAILDRMDEVARNAKLDDVGIMHCGNVYRRKGKEVSNQGLDELDDLYCEHIHPQGFEALWTPEKGWH